MTVLTQCWIETNIQKSQGVGRGFGVSNLSPLTGRQVGPLQLKISANVRPPLTTPLRGFHARAKLHCLMIETLYYGMNNLPKDVTQQYSTGFELATKS